jgi:hypothetical protein
MRGKAMRPSAFTVATLLLSLGMLGAPAAITLAATPAAATNQHRSHPFRHHTVSTVQPPARIACTVLGCQPIPGACTPVPGRTWSGLPTGYDVVVCPPGVSPLR